MTEFQFELIEIPGHEHNSDDIYKLRALKIYTLFENQIVRTAIPALEFLVSLQNNNIIKSWYQ